LKCPASRKDELGVEELESWRVRKLGFVVFSTSTLI